MKYQKTTTASRCAETKARERSVHVSKAYYQTVTKDEAGVEHHTWAVDAARSKGTYRKAK